MDSAPERLYRKEQCTMNMGEMIGIFICFAIGVFCTAAFIAVTLIKASSG